MTSFSQQFSNQQQNPGGTVGGGRHSTAGMNLMQTSNMGRPLFSRDRSKMVDSFNTFDPSEFPSLMSRESASSHHMPSFSRSSYGVMAKQPTMEPNEFTMSNEDFPALRGPPPSASYSSTLGQNLNQLGQLSDDPLSSARERSLSGLSDAPPVRRSMFGQHEITNADSQLQKRGIQTSPDGRVTNIPSSMVTDQYGMIGLLTFIRAAETDPNLVSLALGYDLTTLDLNLNSEVSLHPTFGGPWAKTPCRPQDIDYHVPFEYLTNSSIRDKLAPVRLNRYKDDVLFFMLYTSVGDVLQLAAAAELYNRDWRYHKEDKVWITRAPGMPPAEKTSTYERGTYYFFDVVNWRKVPKEFHLDYDKLEVGPSLPADHFPSGPSVDQGQGSSNNLSTQSALGLQQGSVLHNPTGSR